jgi:prephenate dehydrogenase
MFDTVAIVGVGLIGGSLGMALRHRGLARRVIGIARREETLAEAASVGALDEGSLDPAAVATAELVVLCAPVLSVPPLVRALAPHLRAGALVTDVGSTKATLLAEAAALLPPGVELVGGHPMAGSERDGVLAAREDLFENAVWVVTPTPHCRRESVARLEELVRRVGARPVTLEPAPHDEAVARISHLPHVAAAALASAAADSGIPAETLALLVAGGFRDTTRIAASSPVMWRDICLTNRDAVLAGMADLERRLSGFRSALEAANAEELLAFFEAGREAREALVPPTPLTEESESP